MSLKSRYTAVAFLGFGTAICCANGSMAAKEKSNWHLAEIMCGPAAIEKLDEKARQGRIEECNSQAPKFDANGTVAPIPTILAARKKGPKERDKHLRTACPPPKTLLDALTAKRRKEGPKGAGESGCTELKPTPDVPILKRRKGPKGRSGSDAQG